MVTVPSGIGALGQVVENGFWRLSNPMMWVVVGMGGLLVFWVRTEQKRLKREEKQEKRNPRQLKKRK